jgi:hypothetical protein
VLLRLILGIIYIMHAYLAAVVLGPAGMIAYQAKAGVPFPEIATWYLILAHGLGGICLTLSTRIPTCFALIEVSGRTPSQHPHHRRAWVCGSSSPAQGTCLRGDVANAGTLRDSDGPGRCRQATNPAGLTTDAGRLQRSMRG